MLQPDLILASRSPRRQELLAQIGVRFTVLEADIDERVLPAEEAGQYVCRVALSKARRGLALAQSATTTAALPVLGADTSVVLDGECLGKPGDEQDARAMWRALSGREHEVLSAVALVSSNVEELRLCRTRVRFRVISEAEMQAYWASGEPLDKAGGYAIQGLAAIFVASIEGSYSGVMGLPLFETAALLQEQGIDCLKLSRQPGC